MGNRKNLNVDCIITTYISGIGFKGTDYNCISCISGNRSRIVDFETFVVYNKKKE